MQKRKHCDIMLFPFRETATAKPVMVADEQAMRTPSAIAGSILFFLCAPCVVAGLVPWLLTDGYARPLSPVMIVPGLLVAACGIALLLDCFARFSVHGGGTPAPVAPTERLVLVGAYRYVRNPMYVGVLAIILGQALAFASQSLAIYAAVAGAAMLAFVRLYEEPILARRYGRQYDAYRQNVPGWLPRVTPWRGDHAQ